MHFNHSDLLEMKMLTLSSDLRGPHHDVFVFINALHPFSHLILGHEPKNEADPKLKLTTPQETIGRMMYTVETFLGLTVTFIFHPTYSQGHTHLDEGKIQISAWSKTLVALRGFQW